MQLIWQHRTVIRDFNSWNRNRESVERVSKWDKHSNYWVLTNAFWIRFVKHSFVRYTFRFARYRYPQLTFSFSPRRLQDALEDEKLLRWRRFESVFKACLEDILKTSWRPTHVCWVRLSSFSAITKTVTGAEGGRG